MHFRRKQTKLDEAMDAGLRRQTQRRWNPDEPIEEEPETIEGAVRREQNEQSPTAEQKDSDDAQR